MDVWFKRTKTFKVLVVVPVIWDHTRVISVVVWGSPQFPTQIKKMDVWSKRAMTWSVFLYLPVIWDHTRIISVVDWGSPLSPLGQRKSVWPIILSSP